MATTARQRKQFGRTIRRGRKARGITLTALADQLQISKAYLSMIERGQTAPAKFRVHQIAVVIEHDPTELLVLLNSKTRKEKINA